MRPLEGGPGARRAWRCCAALAVAVIAALAGPAAAHGQQVSFVPRKGHAADARLAAFLARGGAEVWSRDTVVVRGDTVRADVLVLEGQARIAGSVNGDVFVVDGDLFLRPGARIAGSVVVLGGGYHGSSLAVVEGGATWLPAERYAVLPEAGGFAIHPVVEEPDPVDLHGLYGFEAPRYQRVDAVILAWGLTLRAPWAWRPTLELVGRYRSGQGAVEGTVRQLWHPGSIEFGVEAERLTRTREGWIRGDVSNSLSYLFWGDDFRDYYTADRVALLARGSGPRAWTPEVILEWEKARSRRAGDHFTLFGSDDVRPNPGVDDGETWSASAALAADLETGGGGRLTGRAGLEVADSTIAGDFSYVRAEVTARWRTPGPAAHEIDLFALATVDLSGELPRQRWSGFGGRATLPTFDVMAMRGPRVLYGHADYFVPIERLRAGGLGAPGVFGRIGAGTAWRPEDPVDWKVNLVAGLRFWLVEGGAAWDPDTGDVKGYGIVRFPGDL